MSEDIYCAQCREVCGSYYPARTQGDPDDCHESDYDVEPEFVDDDGNEFCSQACRDLYHKSESEPEIVTVRVCPPIPARKFDWCAYYEGAEETGNYGWGVGEDDAIAALESMQQDTVTQGDMQGDVQGVTQGVTRRQGMATSTNQN
jgi:hypothetical protein